MITGSYTNIDGGVHAAAVARVVKMTVDLIASTNAIAVEVYHDMEHALPPPPVKGPEGLRQRLAQRTTIAVAPFSLAKADFTTDLRVVYAWLLKQEKFKGWKLVADQLLAPIAKA